MPTRAVGPQASRCASALARIERVAQAVAEQVERQHQQEDREAGPDRHPRCLVDADFQAQSEHDREWAKRTMTVLFLQNTNVKVVALTSTSRITGETSGETDAQVVLAGGRGLLPERASPYSVKLQWRREGRQWRLARLDWQ